MSENSSSAPAGWYPNPAGGETYWDGSQWTAHRDVAAPAAPVAPSAPEVPAAPKRPWYKRPAILIPAVSGVALVGLVIAAGVGGSRVDDPSTSTSASSVADTAETPVAQVEKVAVPDVVGMSSVEAKAAMEAAGLKLGFVGESASTEGAVVVEQTPAAGTEAAEGDGVNAILEVPEPQMTLGQKNAVAEAQSYLDYAGFSRAGLLDQLTSEYGAGYEVADAKFALSYLEDAGLVDWNAEAVESAESYLEYSSFSRADLFDQLTSEYGAQFTEGQAKHALAAVGY